MQSQRCQIYKKCEELRSQNSHLENTKNRKLILNQQLTSEDIDSCLQQVLARDV